MKKVDLNGTWELYEAEHRSGMSLEGRLDVEIPGSVLSGLLKNDQIEDPFYRRNEDEARELFWNDYVFEREFVAEENVLRQDRVELVCEGLDTLAEIYINGRLIAKTNNMHRTYRFDVRNQLCAGENKIRIRLNSTLQYISDCTKREGKSTNFVNCGVLEGSQLIRKAHSMFGWDWGPQMIDAGIWRDIYLEAYSHSLVEEVSFHQEHASMQDAGSAELVRLTAKAGIAMDKADKGSDAGRLKQGERLCFRLFDPSGALLETQTISGQAADYEATFEIHSPRLWWPRGYGDQPLYTVELALMDEQEEPLWQKGYELGLRTLTVSQQKDEWGKEFAFAVNGIKIFAMGANYIPEDVIYSRISHEVLDRLLDASVRAGFNCLRVWGGGYYPSDYFYEQCDRLGIIIWQDLMFACNVYNFTQELEENVTAELQDNVRRLRHHACLGLWCGNNELEVAWVSWADFQGESMMRRADYIRQFEHVLPKEMERLAPDTFYWPSSPSSGGCFEDTLNENVGDTHYWEVWHGMKPFTEYQQHYFRFCSEFGFQSFPCLKTVEAFTLLEDRNVFSRVMEQHQKNPSANGKILSYLSENFCYPKDFDSLLYVSQIMQAIAMQTGVEHFRRNRGRCMGSLYWQLNDNWPVASWSGIDYYGRWKALHYLACRFYAPVSASMLLTADKAEAYVANETRQEAQVKVSLTLKTTHLETIDVAEILVTVPALSSVKVMERDYRPWVSRDSEDALFVELRLEQADGKQQTEAAEFVPYKYLGLPKAECTCIVSEQEERFCISLKSDALMLFTELQVEGADVIFSDNYFHLTGEEPYLVYVKKKDIVQGKIADAQELKKRLHIRSLRDSFYL